MPASPSSLRITLVKSPIGYTVRQKATVRALGLRRLRQAVVRPDNEAIRGMIFKIQHLVQVEPATDDVRRTMDDGGPGSSPVVGPQSSEGAGGETTSRPATRATATSRRRSSEGDVDETA